MPPFLLPLLGTNPVSTADDVMSGRGWEWRWVGMIGFPPPTLRIASPPKVPCWFCRHRRRSFRSLSVRSSNTVRLEKFLRPSRATEQCAAAATARRARGARCLLPASFIARMLPTLETMLGSGGRGKAESVGGNGCTFTPFGPAVDRAAKYIEDESMFVEGEIDSISVCRPKWCPPSPVARSSRKVHFSAHSALSTPRPLLVFSPLLSSVR